MNLIATVAERVLTAITWVAMHVVIISERWRRRLPRRIRHRARHARRRRELLETSGSRLKTIDGEIARQRKQIDAVMAALVTVPGSKALGGRLATEEAKLAELEAQRSDVAADERPKVMPHPALIARYVEDLLVTLDTDVPKARAILQRVLRPFTLTPDGASYRISGALDLSAMLGSGVSEKYSSGGVI